MSKVPLVIGLGLLALAVYGGVLSLKSSGVIVGSTLVILAAPIILVLCLIIALISVFFCFIKPLVKLSHDLSQSTNNNPSKQTQNSQNSEQSNLPVFFSDNRSASTKTGNSGQETCEQHLTADEEDVVNSVPVLSHKYSPNKVVNQIIEKYIERSRVRNQTNTENNQPNTENNPQSTENLSLSSNVVSYQEVTNTQSSNVSNKRVENGEPCSNSDTSNNLPAQSKTKELARQNNMENTEYETEMAMAANISHMMKGWRGWI